MENKINCDVCDKTAFKYKCPRCEFRTCSLTCVNIHKLELNCDGIRDSTAYVPISKFNNLNLLSDYRFLENVDRTISNCRRNPHKRYTRFKQGLPNHLARLKAAARKRKTSLQFLPQHFTRHAENKTKLDYSSNEITWKIDFIFPQGDLVKITEVINENTKLASILSKYLDPVSCPNMYKQYLKFYHASGLSDVYALLKAERVGKPNGVFMLDLGTDVKSNLAKKVIIEYPVVFIIKKAFKDEYVVLEDNDEEEHNIDDGNKYGFFGDFKPIGYFDSLVPQSKKKKLENEAIDSINDSAEILRYGAVRMKNVSESEDEPETSVYPPKISIPSYDQLCSL